MALSSVWTSTKRALSALDRFFAYLVPVMLFGVSGLALYASVFDRIPPPEEMVLVTGPVEFYRVERSRGDHPITIHFKMWNDDTPYRTNELHKDWISGKLNGTTVEVAFYIESGPVFRKGAVETFGMTVNGQTIKTLDDDIADETMLRRYVFPLLALILFGFGYWKWPRKTQLALQPDGSMAEARVDKGFEPTWEKLTPRRQFVRSAWISGLAMLYVLLAKPQLLWILGAAVGCSIWMWSTHRAWRDDVER